MTIEEARKLPVGALLDGYLPYIGKYKFLVVARSDKFIQVAYTLAPPAVFYFHRQGWGHNRQWDTVEHAWPIEGDKVYPDFWKDVKRIA